MNTSKCLDLWFLNSAKVWLRSLQLKQPKMTEWMKISLCLPRWPRARDGEEIGLWLRCWPVISSLIILETGIVNNKKGHKWTHSRAYFMLFWWHIIANGMKHERKKHFCGLWLFFESFGLANIFISVIKSQKSEFGYKISKLQTKHVTHISLLRLE